MDLQPRVLGALELLLEEPGAVVDRDTFLDELWPDVIVSPNSVDQVIRRLRHELGDPSLVVTVPRRGYRITDDVIELDDQPPWASFVGRASELRTLEQALVEPGLVTLWGPGGVGKTRLARELARRRKDAVFVDLTAARDSDGLVWPVAGALDVPATAADPVGQIAAALAHRDGLLLILDNLEQVRSAAAEVIERWCRHAPGVAVLATSRVALQVPGERVVGLEPLAPAAARKLFQDRVSAVRPGFTLSEQERQWVDPLLARLDHLPLAIELVAARARLFAPRELLALVAERLDAVRAPGGDDPRRANMVATLDWSWELLSEPAKALLAQASVFRRGFSLDAIEAVARLGAEAPPVEEVVQELFDASLLRTEALASGWSRFVPYEVVRRYASARLDDPAPVWARHAAAFARHGSDEALDALTAHGGIERRKRVAELLDDLVAAAQRPVDPAHASACCLAAHAVMKRSGPFEAGVTFADDLLARNDLAPATRARLLASRGRLLLHGPRAESAVEDLDRAAELHESLGETGPAARALAALGQAQRDLGRSSEGYAAAQRARALAQEAGDLPALADTLHELSARELDSGRVEAARVHCERALAIARERGDLETEGRVLGFLGVCMLRLGHYREGREAYEQSLALRARTGDRGGQARQLTNLGHLYQELDGQYDQAQVYYEQALSLARSIGERFQEAAVLVSLGVLYANKGEWDLARQHHERALLIAREAGYPKLEGIAVDNLGQAYHHAGRLGEAEAALSDAVALFHDSGNRRHEGIALGNLAETVLARGRLDDAAALVARGEAILREVSDNYHLANILSTRAMLERARGDQRAFVATLGEAGAMFDRLDLDPSVPIQERFDRLLHGEADH